MDASHIWIAIAVMAGVTYLIRFLPFLILRREIRNPYFRAFLRYVPYATLTAMTVPGVISDAAVPTAGAVGLLTAVIAAFFGRSLLTCAFLATVAAGLTEYLL